MLPLILTINQVNSIIYISCQVNVIDTIVMVRCEISNKLPIVLMMFRKTLQFVFSVIFK